MRRPRDLLQRCLEQGFVLLAAQFSGESFEVADLRRFVLGGGFAGWHRYDGARPSSEHIPRMFLAPFAVAARLDNSWFETDPTTGLPRPLDLPSASPLGSARLSRPLGPAVVLQVSARCGAAPGHQPAGPGRKPLPPAGWVAQAGGQCLLDGRSGQGRTVGMPVDNANRARQPVTKEHHGPCRPSTSSSPRGGSRRRAGIRCRAHLRVARRSAASARASTPLTPKKPNSALRKVAKGAADQWL